MRQMPTQTVATIALAVGSDSILMQEAHGAAAVRESHEIPKQNPGRDTLALFGIEVGAPCADDPLFVSATWPAGWKRDSTGHSMWTNVIAPWSAGPVFKIFYKAAFYDRSAHMSIMPRFNLDPGYTDETAAIVKDEGTGAILHRIPIVKAAGEKGYETSDRYDAMMVEWCNANLFAGWANSKSAWLRLMAEKAQHRRGSMVGRRKAPRRKGSNPVGPNLSHQGDTP